MTRLVFFKVGPGPTMMAADVFDCEGMTDEQIDSHAYWLATEQADSYGDFVPEDDERLNDENDPGPYFTESDLDYFWEDYVPEKHDMYRAGGGSFMDDFED